MIRQRGKSWEVIIKRKKALNAIGIENGQYSFTVTSKEQAEIDHDRICGQIDSGHISPSIMSFARNIQRNNTKTTIKEVWRIMHSDTVYDSSQSVIDIMAGLLETMGDVIIGDFDVSSMLDWIELLKTQNIAPSTIRKKVGALRSVFRYAALDDNMEISLNVFDKLPRNYSDHKGAKDKRNIKVRRDVKRDRRLMDGELELLYQAIDDFRIDPRRKEIAEEIKPATLLMFEMAINTGMRLQEIFLLKWVDVNFTDRGLIRILATNTKSNTERFVPLSSILKPLLKDHYIRFGSVDEYVFPFMRSYQFNIENCSVGLSHMWKRITVSVGIESLRFHDLRHEGISRMVERTTLTIAQLMKISGHGDMRTFQRYVNLRASEIGDMY